MYVQSIMNTNKYVILSIKAVEYETERKFIDILVELNLLNYSLPLKVIDE